MTSEKIDEAFVDKGAKKISDKDVEHVVNKARCYQEKVQRGKAVSVLF